MDSNRDPFEAKDFIKLGKKSALIYRLNRLEDSGIGKISNLPYSIKILLESLLRQIDGRLVTREDVEVIARWSPKKNPDREVPFIPARVILQDFTGVPAIVDLAAMRSALQRLGGNPTKINPLVHADLVIDHSIQVDHCCNSNALDLNEKKEFERNHERYMLLRWAQKAFDNLRVVPPGRGIIHQINLEYLASVVQIKKINENLIAYPDTLVGTDSHTTTINGLGVLGWGVGGIEAEAIMLGQPYYMPIPDVIGVKLYGELSEGITATDIVLTITRKLREHGVVNKFVEFFGPGLANLTLPDRATIANMAPEYGATIGFFPIDDETLHYLHVTGRGYFVKLIKSYLIEQGLFLTNGKPAPVFSEILEVDLSTIEPSLAGPKRPQDRISLKSMKGRFYEGIEKIYGKKISAQTKSNGINHGSVVLAAITSCTNTSNPSVLLGAGLLAKKAVELGLSVKPYVKTSLAPGSHVVTEYLKASGLLPYLEKLGFYIAGYGCTTCIGNSGPLQTDIANAIQENDLIVIGVISGNRNFEGRIHPLVKANYLASPLLVVAYAITGTIDIDLTKEPLGYDRNNKPVYLRDVWPKSAEIKQFIKKYLNARMFEKQYSKIFEGSNLWNDLEIPEGKSYDWGPKSTYIREPPFFKNFPLQPAELKDIEQARVLAILGDSITTDHISPAGDIPSNSPAGKYLISQNIDIYDFNSFGSRRGNHEVMMRGTFSNIRLKNKLVPEKEGGWTCYLPTGEIMAIYDAAMKYQENNIPLIVIAGKEFGEGSSRDWAAKGPFLLGVKAIIAISYERIHRSNLVGMGILPLQFLEGENADKLGLKGDETYKIEGIKNLKPGGELNIIVENKIGAEIKFKVKVRLDTPIELEYYRNGGILHTVLRRIIGK